MTGFLQLGTPRVDVLCYGSTRLEAQNIADAVVTALQGLDRRVFRNTLLHWAQISMEPMPLTDGDQHWPFYAVSAQVAHSRQTVT